LSRRWFLFVGGGVVAALVVVAAILSIGDNITYYYFPNEAIENRGQLSDGERFRLAGTVVPGSIAEEGDELEFVVTDGSATIDVRLTDLPPPLFRDDVPVLIEGSWQGDIFVGDTALIRHDENYEIPSEGGAVESG
jgi:cytochrome c-type biogenesis protein CcmE